MTELAARIQEAHDRIREYVRETPVERALNFERAMEEGTEVFLKLDEDTATNGLAGMLPELIDQHSSGGNLLEAVPDDATSVSRRVARNDGLARFIEGLEALDNDDRRLLIYRGLEGLMHEDVAKILDLSVSAVEKRWQRLRARLDSSALPYDLFV